MCILRATPTECSPFLGRLVSSLTRKASEPPMSLSTHPPTTSSTSNAISHRQERTEPAGHQPGKRGVKLSSQRNPTCPRACYEPNWLIRARYTVPLANRRWTRPEKALLSSLGRERTAAFIQGMKGLVRGNGLQQLEIVPRIIRLGWILYLKKIHIAHDAAINT